jgi:hypothetical protein
MPDYVLQVYVLVVTVLLIRGKYTFCIYIPTGMSNIKISVKLFALYILVRVQPILSCTIFVKLRLLEINSS